MKLPTSHNEDRDGRRAGPQERARRIDPTPRRLCLGVVVVVAVSAVAPLGADVVTLKNGKRIEGEVSEGGESGKILVTVDESTVIELEPDEIAKIDKRKSPLRRFSERLKMLREDDLEGLVELAAWAREHRLMGREKEVYRRILAIDPNHEVARKGLGFVVFRNRWVKEKELRREPGYVEMGGEWVPVAEKIARDIEKLRREIADDFRGVDSDNPHIQEYSVRRLMEYKSPYLSEVLLDYLDHPSQSVRVVSIQLLGVALKGAAAANKKPPKSKNSRHSKVAQAQRERQQKLDSRIGEAVLDRTLNERAPVVRRALLGALRKMRHHGFFQLALRAASSSEDPRQRQRAAQGVLYALRTDWVVELIEALEERPPGETAPPGNPALLAILERLFKQDFSYDVAAWKEWWRQNSYRYIDDV